MLTFAKRKLIGKVTSSADVSYQDILLKSFFEIKKIQFAADRIKIDEDGRLDLADELIDSGVNNKINISDYFNITSINQPLCSNLFLHQALCSYARSYNFAYSLLDEGGEVDNLLDFFEAYAEMNKCLGCLVSAVGIGVNVKAVKNISKKRSEAAKSSHLKPNLQKLFLELLSEVELVSKNKFNSKKDLFDFIEKKFYKKIWAIINHANEIRGNRSKFEYADKFMNSLAKYKAVSEKIEEMIEANPVLK